MVTSIASALSLFSFMLMFFYVEGYGIASAHLFNILRVSKISYLVSYMHYHKCVYYHKCVFPSLKYKIPIFGTEFLSVFINYNGFIVINRYHSSHLLVVFRPLNHGKYHADYSAMYLISLSAIFSQRALPVYDNEMDWI